MHKAVKVSPSTPSTVFPLMMPFDDLRTRLWSPYDAMESPWGTFPKNTGGKKKEKKEGFLQTNPNTT